MQAENRDKKLDLWLEQLRLCGVTPTIRENLMETDIQLPQVAKLKPPQDNKKYAPLEVTPMVSGGDSP